MASLLGRLPKADWLLADWAMTLPGSEMRGIRPCVLSRKSRGKSVKHDKRRDKRRNRNETMFGRLKDRRGVATRYDRRPKIFLSAVALAATLIFRL